MKITVVGTGYVGLVSGVCYAELGHSVICVDKDPLKVATLQNGEIPIYEPGLQELSVRNAELGRLRFTSSLGDSVKGADLIVIAVGTPPLPGGQANLAYIELAAQEIADAMEGHPVVAIKSTVPVGTNEKVRELIRERTDCPFDSVSLPEFLREGSAVSDTMHPDRIVIGTDSPRAEALLRELHAGLGCAFVVTDIRSAEMIKYASNAFLATKISFINEIANICEKVGADVTRVAEGMGRDKRIGASFLKAGIGYGGSCFPKDTQALIQIAGHVDYEFKLLRSVVEVNQDQRFNVIRKLETIFGGELSGRTVAVWGLAFKPDTDDVREAPAQEIIGELLARGVEVRVYDPIAMDNFRSQFGSGDGSVVWCGSALEAAAGSDAVCLLTEWSEFGETDLQRLRAVVREPVLIDGRNAFDEAALQGTDFIYYSVGRPSLARGVKAPVPELSY
ncbi:UDP-glucose/GDP-mannose dehydrogenase family protein [Paenibacillus sp. FSL W8-1187]|uniref:UDP-glucose dehydrogenase family protein n=1 Tax=Paenibacillus sp. FSL W8-1187 TaxID=2975339 RepID=UPI0030D78C2B